MRSEACGTAREHTDPPADSPQTWTAGLFRSPSSADAVIRPRMHRVPLTLRALLLVPLLAVAVDQARATLVCGTRAESCLAAAGQGWLGAAGIALLVVYALAGALCVARLARPYGAAARWPVRGGPVPMLRLWAVGSAGLAA